MWGLFRSTRDHIKELQRSRATAPSPIQTEEVPLRVQADFAQRVVSFGVGDLVSVPMPPDVARTIGGLLIRAADSLDESVDITADVEAKEGSDE